MKNLILVLLLVFASITIAGEKINKSLDVSPDGEVEIHNNRGNIKITGWDKNQVVVKGELDDLTEKFIFSSEGNKTIIKVILPNRNVNRHSGEGSKLTIFVPENVFVQFGGVATYLDFSKINGGIEVNSVSGDVKIGDSKKRAYINSVSGKIDITGFSGNLKISTVSGDINATVSAKKIDINGVSSNISVKTDNIDIADISTVSGYTDLYGHLNENGDISLSNVSGDSYFYVTGELNARISLDTGPGGDVINKYSDDKVTSSFIGSEKLKFTAGNGEGLIRMSTVSGEIGLKRAK